MFVYFSASVRGLLRIDSALETLSDENFFALACTGPRYSDSTLKKHIWVNKLYLSFSERSGIVPFPLNARHAAWFIRMIGLEAGYAVGSIEDVIIPSLKRIHRERTGVDTSAEINASLTQALKDIKKSPSQRRNAVGKEPAITEDVERIIYLTPDGLPTKAEEASLWLTSVSTGARAVTCSNVKIGDIKRML